MPGHDYHGAARLLSREDQLDIFLVKRSSVKSGESSRWSGHSISHKVSILLWTQCTFMASFFPSGNTRSDTVHNSFLFTITCLTEPNQSWFSTPLHRPLPSFHVKTCLQNLLQQAWGVQRHYFRVGSHLNLQTVENETFQSSPAQSSVVHIPWYTRVYEVKPTFGMTRGDFSEVYWHSGVQVLFVTVFQTAVDPLCKNSLTTGSLLGYLDSILSNHTVGCRNIIFSFLSQIRRENFYFPSKNSIFFVVIFCETAVVSMPRLANFSPCNPLIVCLSPTLYAHSLLKNEFFSNVYGQLFREE